MNTAVYAAVMRKRKMSISTIDLKMIYNANVITAAHKANTHLLHNDSKTEVWFLYTDFALIFKQNCTCIDTYNSHIKLQFVQFASHSQSLQDDF